MAKGRRKNRERRRESQRRIGQHGEEDDDEPGLRLALARADTGSDPVFARLDLVVGCRRRTRREKQKPSMSSSRRRRGRRRRTSVGVVRTGDVASEDTAPSLAEESLLPVRVLPARQRAVLVASHGVDVVALLASLRGWIGVKALATVESTGALVGEEVLGAVAVRAAENRREKVSREKPTTRENAPFESVTLTSAVALRDAFVTVLGGASCKREERVSSRKIGRGKKGRSQALSGYMP